MANVMHIKTFGGSMYPFFSDGDVVIVRKVPFAKINVNDIVTVRKNSHFFTHRVIYTSNGKGKTQPFVITKGDRNLKSDGKAYARQIIGKLDRIKRNNTILKPQDFYLTQSTLYFEEIVRIKRKLEEANINFVFLKGLPYHLYFEKEQPKRIYIDCDVLIEKIKLQKAQNILKKSAYQRESSWVSQRGEDKEEQSFYKKIGGQQVVFDVHGEAITLMAKVGGLTPLYPARLISEFSAMLFREKHVVRLHGENFPLLTTDNLILFSAFHLFHHNFRGYFRYEFLHRLFKDEPVDFNHIANKILHFRLENFVYPVFVMLKQYYSTPIPPDFLATIRPKGSCLSYIEKHIMHVTIFDIEARTQGGVTRFKNLFSLSPQPLSERLSIFLNIEVASWIIWVVKRRITRRFFSFLTVR